MKTRETPAGLRQAVTSLVYKLSTDMLFEPDLHLHSRIISYKLMNFSYAN